MFDILLLHSYDYVSSTNLHNKAALLTSRLVQYVYAAAAARICLSEFTVFTPTTSRYNTIQISAMAGTMTMNAWICSWKSGTRNAVMRCTRYQTVAATRVTPSALGNSPDL